MFCGLFGWFNQCSRTGCKITVKAKTSETFPDIKISKAFGVKGTWKYEDECYVTQISQLMSGKKKNYILELTIPKSIKSDHKISVKVASVFCSIKGLYGDKTIKFTKKADLIISVDEFDEIGEAEDDPDVMFHHYRVKGAEVMNEAKLLSDQGKYEKAKEILQNIKDELRKSSMREKEIMKNLIRDIDSTIQSIKPEIYKTTGRCSILQNVRAHMEERSTPFANVKYSNALQLDMVSQAKSRRATKV